VQQTFVLRTQNSRSFVLGTQKALKSRPQKVGKKSEKRLEKVSKKAAKKTAKRTTKKAHKKQ